MGKELDGDESESISREEWFKFLEREEAQVCFLALDIDETQFQTPKFFDTIDLDRNDCIFIDEFILCCMNMLQGDEPVSEAQLLKNNVKLMSGIENLLARTLEPLGLARSQSECAPFGTKLGPIGL